MNQIEQRFYNAFKKVEKKLDEDWEIVPEFVVGIYRVDFLVQSNVFVEIDGQEFHKTKEQRFYDYQRERFLLLNGYFPVRFMGTEVFLNAEKCVEEVMSICNQIESLCQSFWSDGHDVGTFTAERAAIKVDKTTQANC